MSKTPEDFLAAGFVLFKAGEAKPNSRLIALAPAFAGMNTSWSLVHDGSLRLLDPSFRWNEKSEELERPHAFPVVKQQESLKNKKAGRVARLFEAVF
ncbi:hypothetical protein [Labrenzia sp. PHM005]|uniref:hypothetical protein n=1 Tax=Labrenzia sp. PHM005 TaxID=2590016 RepID=UPI0011405B42|nr:hypothetical protein [Labrenzia sp. PHM005]QDG76509.1 hypothetical protein FJ695_11865 [Labrenzia sp. PHM005]